MRLPRDWLGPREELVPFGPRAASVEEDEPPPSSEDPPPSPADFWGEQSAALQSALEAPTAPGYGRAGSGGERTLRVDRRALLGVAAVLALSPTHIKFITKWHINAPWSVRPRRRRHSGAVLTRSRGVSTVEAAVEAGVSEAVGVRWFREGGGMPSVTVVPLSGRYLSFAERRRSLCCAPRSWGCVRSPGGSVVRRRRSRGSCAATPGLAAAR